MRAGARSTALLSIALGQRGVCAHRPSPRGNGLLPTNRVPAATFDAERRRARPPMFWTANLEVVTGDRREVIDARAPRVIELTRRSA